MPLPWSGDSPPFGFSLDGAAAAAPWLPQPAAWKAMTAASLEQDPQSMLRLYRAAIAIRRQHPALGDGSMRWLDAPDGVLAFTRDPGFTCAVNFTAAPWPLPAGGDVLLASGPVPDGQLPPDTAAWLADPE